MQDQLPTTWALLIGDQIPLLLKVSFTLFVCILVPVYWVQYGPGNFLWFSDIALLLTVPALWLESALLASMMALAVGLLELAWIVDFFVRLISGVSVTGLSRYMFDSKISLAIRGLSLFHLGLPVLIFWMIYRMGYDDRAFALQSLLSWVVLPLSYLFSKPSENVNWVYGFKTPQRQMPPLLYLSLLMILLPLIIYLPTHLLVQGLL
jgi:hypothetical protein